MLQTFFSLLHKGVHIELYIICHNNILFNFSLLFLIGLMHQYRREAHGSKLKIIAMSADFSEQLIAEVMR